jgi:hypothetical protein
VCLTLEETPERLLVRVVDNGSGMTPETLERALDPFYTDGKKHVRRVGLGLPFLQQLAEDTGGSLRIDTRLGEGTTVEAELDPRHVDVPPVEAWSATLLGLMSFGGDYELRVERRGGTGTYTVSRRALIEALGDWGCAGALGLARRYLEELEQTLAEMDSMERGS